MKKKILIFFVLALVPLSIISCKKDDNSIPISLNMIDIDMISNKKLLSTINDSSLKEGVYLLDTNSNKYIFFNGKTKNYTNITCTLDEKTLIIKSDIENSNACKKLYLIKEQNVTSSNEKARFYNKIKLVIDNKESKFESFVIND